MKKIDKKVVIKQINNSLFYHFNIKIICFFLASAFYLFLTLFVQRDTKIYNCKLNVISLNDNLMITNKIPNSVELTVKDRQNVLYKLSENDFNVRLDLSNIAIPDKYRLKLKWNLPNSIHSIFSYIKLNPDELDINVEEIIEKNVKIIFNLTGKLPPGYVRKNVVLEPPTVRIQGPKSIIDNIKIIHALPISIEGAKDSIKNEVEFKLESQLIKVLGKADIFIEIKEEANNLLNENNSFFNSPPED